MKSTKLRIGLLSVAMIAAGSLARAQSGPGGVSAAAWYRADVSSDVTLSGNKVTGWKDNKGTGKDLAQGTAAWQPVYSTSDALANFNPSITFSGGQWLNTNGVTSASPIINRATGGLFIAGRTGNTVSQAGLAGFHASMDYPGLHTSNTNSQKQMLFFTGGPGYQGLSPNPLDVNIFEPNTPFLGGATWQNATTYTDATVSMLGQRADYPTSSNKVYNVNMSADAENFYVGGDNNWGKLNGQINEVAIFPTKLTPAEMDKVESYMAVKYGITYMHGAKNYVNSSGSVIWDATTNSGNKNNIAGIGRDNAGGLYQKQSRSENSGQKLIIGVGGLANSNASNSGSLTDGQFLMWGDNGMAQKPTVLFAQSGLSHRFAAVWKVQNTGTVGDVRIAWPKVYTNMRLLVSTDSTFATGVSDYSMGQTVSVNGTTYAYVDATITDGKYFTFGAYINKPGGIELLPAVWYKPENVMNATWRDASINGVDLTSNVNGSTGPAINDGNQAHNFNTWTNKYSNVNYYNDLTGKSEVFGVWNDGGGTSTASSDYAGGYYYMPLTVFGVARDTVAGGGSGLITGIDNELANASEPGFGVYGGLQRFYRFGNGAGVSGAAAPINLSAVYSWRPPAGGSSASGTANIQMGLNGAYTNALMNRKSSVAGPYVKIGYSASDWGAFPGDIQEVIWFKDSLSNEQIVKVESYLALKFGTTLAHDYVVNVPSDTLYNFTTNAGYVSNIAGIGKDLENGDIDQRQSNSINVGDQVLIGTTGLANTNDENTIGLTQGQYLVWGDNGEAKAPTVYAGNLGHGVNMLFKSIWKVQNTGSVGTVRVAWPQQYEELMLVQSADDVFTSSDVFTNMIPNVTNINGVAYNYADVTLANGQYFTFASRIKHAPGGVFNNLSVWYRADIDAENTGVGTDVTQWTDYARGVKSSPFGTDALPKFKAGDSSYLNFNPGVNFTATNQAMGNINMSLLGSLDFDVFSATKEGMSGARFFNVGMNNTTFNGTNWDQPSFYTSGDARRNNLESGAGIVMSITAPQPSYVAYQPNVMYHHFTDSSFVATSAGHTLGTVTNHSKIGKVTGGFIFGANNGSVTKGDDAGFVGSIGDLIVYGNGSITPSERNRVESYLAIKYGTTMDTAANYVSSASTIVWDKTLDKSFYKNVAGLAWDTTSALFQKQSRSQINNNPNDQVTIGLGSIEATNAANTSNLTEGQFLMWGDNGNTVAMSNVASTYTEFTYGSNSNNRHMTRIWKARNTNNVDQNTLIRFPKASVGTTTLPAEGVNTGYVIIFASDSAITQNLVLRELTDNGTNWEVDAVFPAGVSYFTFGKIQDVTPLPIRFVQFKATAKEQTAVLTWTTANEFNNKGFVVERNTNSKVWENLGFVTSLAKDGNSRGQLNYQFVDETPAIGLNQYRLKQVDFDGHYVYSPIRVLSFTSNGLVKVYPNPTSETLIIEGLRGKNNIVVTNVLGQEVIKLTTEDAKVKLDASKLAAGSYFINIVDENNEVNNFKFIKQ